MDSRLLAAVVVIAAVAAAGALAYERLHSGASTATQGPGGQTGRKLVLPLHEGDVLLYNITSYFTSLENGTANTTTQSYTENVTVTGFDSDFLLAVSLQEGNKTGSGKLPYGLLALPRGSEGSATLNLPVLVPPPIGGVCMELRLQGSEGGLLTYSGQAEVPGYGIFYEALYNSSTGIMVHANVTLRVDWANVTVSYTIDLLRYTPNTSAPPLERSLEPGAYCGALSASDLRLLADGFYVLQNGKPEPINGDQARQALGGPAVFVLLNKYCPHCQRFWPTLLNASKDVHADVYLIVFSGNTGFANPAIRGLVSQLLNATSMPPSSLGTPAVFVIPGSGRQPAFRTGEMSAQAFVSFVNSVLGS